MFSKIRNDKDFIIILLLLFNIIIVCFSHLISDARIKIINNKLENMSYKYEIDVSDTYNKKYYSSEEENLVVEELEKSDTDITYSNRWNIQLTSEEIYLLAKIVWLESGNQSLEGQMAVIEVIFNRMIDSYYEGTLEEVLSAPGQFSTWDKRNIATPTADVYKAISNVLNGESDILTLDTLYFGRSSNGRTIVKNIEEHYFCK